MSTRLSPGLHRCPAHPDRSPSLSIRRGADRWLLHCHAGCSTEAILAAWGLTWRDLFDGHDMTPPRPRPLTDAHAARLQVIVRDARARAKRAEHLAEWQAADDIRRHRRLAHWLRDLATAHGDCEPAWILADWAAYCDRQAGLLEGAMDEGA